MAPAHLRSPRTLPCGRTCRVECVLNREDRLRVARGAGHAPAAGSVTRTAPFGQRRRPSKRPGLHPIVLNPASSPIRRPCSSNSSAYTREMAPACGADRLGAERCARFRRFAAPNQLQLHCLIVLLISKPQAWSAVPAADYILWVRNSLSPSEI